jgi:cytochrome P450
MQVQSPSKATEGASEARVGANPDSGAMRSSYTRFDQVPFLEGAHPFFGHLRQIRDDRIGFLQRAIRSNRGNALLRIKNPTLVPIFFARTPEALHEVMVERAEDFGKSGVLRFGLYPIAGEGLFTAQWDHWKPNRRLMAPLFQPSALGGYADAMVAMTDRVLADFRDGETRIIFEDTNRITMAIAAKTLFDAETFAEAEKLSDALTIGLGFAADHGPSAFAIMHLWSRVGLEAVAKAVRSKRLAVAAEKLHGPLFFYGRKGAAVREAVRTLDDYVASMIARRKEAEREGRATPNDLLTKLLATQDSEADVELKAPNGNKAPIRLSDKQVRDEILTLFIAGHETTATGLAWTLQLLCQHPEIYARVEAEVDAAGPDLGIHSLPSLQLTLRVFKEALRIYPPVYIFARQAVRATRLCGLDLPKQSLAFVSAYALHHDPDVWPEPEKFDPDRFLPENEAKRHRLAWQPFGAGPRVCIGNHFALMEGQLVLAKMLRYARFSQSTPDTPEAFATLRPSNGVPLKITLRGNADKVRTKA